jgi:GAF domain-containing protein
MPRHAGAIKRYYLSKTVPGVDPGTFLCTCFPVVGTLPSLYNVQMDRGFIANLVRLACEAAGGNGATLCLVRGEYLLPYIVHKLPQEYMDGIGPVRIGTQCCGRAVEHKRPWIVTDMLTDSLFAEGRGGAEASPIRAAFSVPVFAGENVIGSLACHYDHPYTPSAADIERNENFAKLIGVSLLELRGIAPQEVSFDSSQDVEEIAS